MGRTFMKPRYSTIGQTLNSAALRYRQPLAQQEWDLATLFGSQPHAEVGDTGPTESPDLKVAQLEAVLFLAREPLSTRKLAKLAKLADGTEARTLLKRLSQRHDQLGSAIQVVEVAGGFQLMTRSQLAPWIGRLHGQAQDVRLSAPALETLAVVAYRQPVVRAEVEAVRGVQCGEILRVLMERELLRIVGRADELGRPFLYGTTKKFLQVFGLRRLDQLPVIDQIHNIAS